MSDTVHKTSILFVCMGNICRSPTAEGVFRHIAREQGLLDSLFVDSAGTHAYHIGEPPDRRAREAAIRRGFDLSEQRARRVDDKDFQVFDMIVAMDHANLESLHDRAGDSASSDIRLMLEFSNSGLQEVPDPYYGGSAGFERVLDLVEEASRGLLEHVRTGLLAGQRDRP